MTIHRPASTPLHAACREADLDLVHALLTQHAGVNALSPHKETPLHAVAAAQDRDDHALTNIAHLLITSGAAVDARNTSRQTPLHLAAAHGNIAVARELINNKAPLNCQDKNGHTPLLLAMAKSHRQMVDLLCQNGANPWKHDKNGRSCLHLALGANDVPVLTHALRVACAHAHLARVQLLIGKSVDVRAVTPLCQRSLLHSLLHKPHGTTDVRCAIAKLLLDAGVDVNARDHKGRTALHLAVHARDQEMIELLCASGANPMLKDNDGVNGLMLAIDREMASSIPLFLSSSFATPQDFIYAWFAGYGDIAFEALKQWTQHHGPLTQSQSDGCFFLAAELQEERLLAFLLREGYSDKNVFDRNNYTPAISALMHNHALLLPDAYALECMRRKVLSHVCGLTGKSAIGTRVFSLEGSASPIMFKAIADALNNYSGTTLLSPEKKEILLGAFENGAHKRTAKEVLSELEENGLCVVESGSIGHSLCLVFYRHPRTGKVFCGICNRGEKESALDNNIEFFSVDPTKLDEKTIETLLKARRSKIRPLHYIYRDLRKALQWGEPPPAPLMEAIRRILPKDQRISNCSYASAKCALRLAWLLLALEDECQVEDVYPAIIPKEIENLGIGQGGSTIFSSCTRDSVRKHGPSAGQKKRGKADAVQNQVFSLLGYKTWSAFAAQYHAQLYCSESTMADEELARIATLIAASKTAVWPPL